MVDYPSGTTIMAQPSSPPAYNGTSFTVSRFGQGQWISEPYGSALRHLALIASSNCRSLSLVWLRARRNCIRNRESAPSEPYKPSALIGCGGAGGFSSS
jgi:hypothetical protein